MKPGFPRLATTRLAIVGVGLMGGSLLLALRSRCAAILAVDPDPEARAWALAHGAQAVAARPDATLAQANAVLLAAPVGAILRVIPQLPRWLRGPALVMDIGSTKSAIAAALAQLPAPLQAVGGHPMAGKAVGGAQHASADLFHHAPFALVELPNTTPHARAWALELVAALGAYPLWMDAAQHDEAVAAISHLPYLLALALAEATPTDAAALIGPGFRSTSRLAATPPPIMADILRTNTPAVRRALARFRAALDALETALAHPETLPARLETGKAHHAALLRRATEAREAATTARASTLPPETGAP